MAKPRAYVETTIPSFYFETRKTLPIAARREWTREWWATAAANYELVTSLATIEELEAGPAKRRDSWLNFLATVPLLEHVTEVDEIVVEYVARKLMPASPSGDALHLAYASFYDCDFLVTWNCKHLANANKFGHIRGVNTFLGLRVPQLVTPLQLLESGR